MGCSGVAEAAGLVAPATAGLVAPAAAGLVAPTAPGLIAPAAAGLVAPAGPGLSVTGTDDPGAAGCWPAGMFVAGACAAAGAFAGPCAAGFVRAAAGGACPGGGDCANEISTNKTDNTDVMNSVFIVEAGV